MSATSPPDPPVPVAELPVLRLRDLRKSFDGIVPAVDGVSLDVAAGEIVTLLGAAGSGKTTALMLVAGFERLDAGEVHVGGRLMRRTPAHRRGIGVVLQDRRLLAHLNVAENVMLPLLLRGVRRVERQRQVGEVLGLLRLGRVAELGGARLSAEQVLRVALARALVASPRLLLLDAPLAGLDAAACEAVLPELRALPGRLGVTVLTTTRDAGEALALGRRVGVMIDGRLRQVGTPAALYDGPVDAVAAQLVGDNNRLSGVVQEVEDDLARIRLSCGPMVEARVPESGGAGVAAGRRCVVSIRPERVAVAAVRAEEMGDGALPATVLETVFRGDHVRLRLLVGLPGAVPAELMVKRPAGAPTGGMGPGDSVAVAWQGMHALALQPEPGA